MAAGAPSEGDWLDRKRNLPMTHGKLTVLRVVGLFLLMQLPLVHGDGWLSPGLSQPAGAKSGSSKKQQSAPAPAPEVRYGSERLPPPVEDMREAILSAVRSGRI